MKFVTRYNYEPQMGLINEEDSKTYQECKDDCDINILYSRYLSKGFTPPNILALEQRYADISETTTFEETLNVQNDVKAMFNDLPSKIREACGYNVDNFIGLISEVQEDKDVQQLQSAVFDKLGMLDRKQELTEKLPSVLPELPKDENHQILIDEGIQKVQSSTSLT